MILPFDDAQREAIRAQRNAVVTAGAGSGKTAVLAERFLWLLANRGATVEQILALTFTQKAAAEMYERIYQRLRSAGDRLQSALEDFDRSQISTLDSFCAEIVRSSCSRYGLSPDFRYDEEAVRRLAEDCSLDFILENIEERAVADLIRFQGFERFWRGLLADLAFRHLHYAPRLDFVPMLAVQLQRCRQGLQERLASLTTKAGRLLAIEPRVKTLQKNQESLRRIAALNELVHREEYGEALALLEGLSLRKAGGRGAPDLEEMNGLVAEIRTVIDDAQVLLHTLEQRFLLEEIFALLQSFQDRFLEAKRLRGLVTFQDVAELTVDILLHDKALRQYYKRRFRHILIDEFQDNNRLQRDLLFLLSERLQSCGDRIPGASELEEDKLFFVGDEKQSIYRFRGADVTVFKSLHHEIEGAGGRTLLLDRNYRSEPGLVAFFNRLFARVLAGASAPEARRPFEARFQPMEPGRETDGLRAQVHLLVKTPSPESNDELAGDREAEAYAVASLVRRCVDQGSLIVGEPGRRRPAGYGDFAVLLRSTGNQIHFERMFRSFGIPYASQNLRSLFLEAPINDFYLLLQLAVYPQDRSAYAGLLRSPFVNLSDETLVRLLLDCPKGSPPFYGLDSMPVDEPGSDRAPERGQPRLESSTDETPSHRLVTDPRELEKLRRGLAVYRFAREEGDRMSLAELIHQLWHRFGYRQTILSDPRYHPYLEFYEHLLRLAEAADRRGEPLVRFLDFLRRNLGRYERLEELEETRSREGEVQLLTIHKSKGLEFPVVVLADMGNTGRFGGPGEAYYRSDDFGIAVNLGRDSYFTRLGSEQEAELEQAEIKRLLYVACTRAKNHLILSGSLGRRRESSPRAHLTLVLEALGLADAFETVGSEAEATEKEDSSAGEDAAAASAARYVASAEPAAGDDLAGKPTASAGEEALAEPAAGDKAAEDTPGYRLELQRIEDLPRSEWSAATAAPAALPIATIAPLYERELVKRTAPRREISVTELCSRLAALTTDSCLDPEATGASDDAAPAEALRGEQLPSLPVDPLLSVGQLENSFGTLTHEMLAATLRNPDQSPPEPEWSRLHIPAELREDCLQSARTLVSGFQRSELGEAARRARSVETELPFVYRWEEGDVRLHISGQIDAVLDTPEELVLIDFKTDRVFREGEYACQLGLYALALEELTGRGVQPHLFLLRGARAVRMTRRFDWPKLFRSLGL